MQIHGTCFAIFVYDVGFSIKLAQARTRLGAPGSQRRFKHTRRGAQHADFFHAPLFLTEEHTPLVLGDTKTQPQLDITLFDFGAISVVYAIELNKTLTSLVNLSDTLYDNEILLADSRKRVKHIMSFLDRDIEKPNLRKDWEDYVIFQIQRSVTDIGAFCTQHAAVIAQILRAESKALSTGEIDDALSQKMSYSPQDMAIIDWYAAILVGDEMDDERMVLEFAVAELLELRTLDADLDDGIDRACEALSRPDSWLRAFKPNNEKIRQIAGLQADSATLYEGVNNALKLVGDQYLARMYRVISARFRLNEWDQGIERKIAVVESIYQKLSDQAETRRLEALEWIIIILIAISIAVYFLPGVN